LFCSLSFVLSPHPVRIKSTAEAIMEIVFTV
jgi:hypothetical protein